MEPVQKPGRSKQDYETPREFLDVLESIYGKMNIDLAASAENAKAATFFTEAEDSLSRDWRKLTGNLWLNPPFGRIEPWAEKCRAAHSFTDRTIFLLTPASVGSEWFFRHVFGYALVRPLLPRLSFDGVAPYPKDLMLSIFGPPPGFVPWHWKGVRVPFSAQDVVGSPNEREGEEGAAP